MSGYQLENQFFQKNSTLALLFLIPFIWDKFRAIINERKNLLYHFNRSLKVFWFSKHCEFPIYERLIADYFHGESIDLKGNQIIFPQVISLHNWLGQLTFFGNYSDITRKIRSLSPI